MNRIISVTALAARIWILTCLVFGAGWLVYDLLLTNRSLWEAVIGTICSTIGSLPVFIALLVTIPIIEKINAGRVAKTTKLVITCFICTLPYGFVGAIFFNMPHEGDNQWLYYLSWVFAISFCLFACSIIAILLSAKRIALFFSTPDHSTYSSIQNKKTMETDQPSFVVAEEKPHSNKTLIKGIITGCLILVMLIPTLFVTNLVTEREQRQKEVVKEVSNKWASNQTLAGPYIYLPYSTVEVKSDGSKIIIKKHLLLLPDNLTVTGDITPEVRPRSIYKVLLYKTSLKSNGNFSIHIPREISTESLEMQDAKICFGITDFKGIEEKIIVNTNGTGYELSPGLPVNDIDESGLSAPINLSVADINKSIAFEMNVKLKGSEQLHFVPLSGNSQFSLHSSWNNPSFDGNNLPSERNVDKNGFTAKWVFNKANLPFGTVLTDINLIQPSPNLNTSNQYNDNTSGVTYNRGSSAIKNSFAFGVTMLQPADQYAKTMRSVKYAILFIGLTFSLFFIVELLQKKPVHPVQYVLVGLALVIFYTLLLSISEFILFDQAYGIASLCTILLITLYAKSHFRNWKTATIFAAVLSALYGFIFVLIQLEDTALLVGSIGLFIVLALVMYASRKINWYHTTSTNAVPG